MSRSVSGFTLIELLVVIATIGVLAAVAIPQFREYRERGFDARARSDLRNVATAEEAYFVDSAVYKSCTQADCPQSLPGLTYLSDGISLSMTGTTSGFFGTSHHPGSGAGVVFNWNSENGGLGGL